jgi:carbon storage regulator CsrA
MHGVLYVCLPRSQARNILQARKQVCEYLSQEGFDTELRFSGCCDYFRVGGRWSGSLTLLRLRGRQPKRLSRKQGEAIVIDGGIRITVVGVKGKLVRLAIDAPRSTRVDREEVATRVARDGFRNRFPAGKDLFAETADVVGSPGLNEVYEPVCFGPRLVRQTDVTGRFGTLVRQNGTDNWRACRDRTACSLIGRSG